MLDTGGWRILMGPEDHETRLYRSDTDPGESHDLALDHTLQTLVLRQAALHQWHWNRRLLGGDGQPAEAQELDPELLEQLEALGYLN